MVKNLMRLGLSVPVGLHEDMRKLSFKRTAATNNVVTLTDVYAEGVTKLVSRIEAGERFVYPVQPRGSVKKISLRMPEEIADLIAKHATESSQSAIVVKGAQCLLQEDE